MSTSRKRQPGSSSPIHGTLETENSVITMKVRAIVPLAPLDPAPPWRATSESSLLPFFSSLLPLDAAETGDAGDAGEPGPVTLLCAI